MRNIEPKTQREKNMVHQVSIGAQADFDSTLSPNQTTTQLLQNKSSYNRHRTNNIYQSDSSAKVSPSTRGKTRDNKTRDGPVAIPGLPLAKITDANRRRIFSPPHQILSSVNALMSSSRRHRGKKDTFGNVRNATFDALGPIANSTDGFYD